MFAGARIIDSSGNWGWNPTGRRLNPKLLLSNGCFPGLHEWFASFSVGQHHFNSIIVASYPSTWAESERFLASTCNAMLNAYQSWTVPTPGLLPFCRGLALRRSLDRPGFWATSLFEASQTNIRCMEVGREMPFQVWAGSWPSHFEEYKPEASTI